MYKMFGAGGQTSEQIKEDQPQTIKYEPYEFRESRHYSFGKLKFIIPAFFILGTIILVTVISQNYLDFSQFAPTPTPAPTLVSATPEPTPEPVQNKKYYNIDLGLSFNYPQEYGILECKENETIYVYKDDPAEPITCDNLTSQVVAFVYGNSSFYPQVTAPDPLPTGEEAPQISEQVILVADQTAVKQIAKTSTTYLNSITFNNDNQFYLIQINSESNLPVYELVYQSFEFVKDQYEDWQTYTNTYYDVKYPPGWSIAETESGQGTIKLSKHADFRTLNAFQIDLEANVTNAQVTASDVISSTKNLRGWAKTPSVNIKNLKKGTALILDGEFEGDWHTFIVIFYKNYLVQILWYDDVERTNQDIFENILASFEFGV